MQERTHYVSAQAPTNMHAVLRHITACSLVAARTSGVIRHAVLLPQKQKQCLEDLLLLGVTKVVVIHKPIEEDLELQVKVVPPVPGHLGKTLGHHQRREAVLGQVRARLVLGPFADDAV